MSIPAMFPEGKVKQLRLSEVRLDGGTQVRVALSPETISEYAEAMAGGANFAPGVCFFDGEHYWLADGFHRHHAALKAGKATIMMEVRKGTKRDALLFAIGANAEHGLRRTNADKRRAVEILLKDPEWGKWSDRHLAEMAGVTNKSVASLRQQLTQESGEEIPHLNQDGRRTGKDGKSYPAPTIRIAEEPAEEGPAVHIDYDSVSFPDHDDCPDFPDPEAPDPEHQPPADPGVPEPDPQVPETSPEREPGDDTAEVKRDMEKARAQPKNGSIVFDYKSGFEAIFKDLYRSIDRLGNAYGRNPHGMPWKDTPLAEGLRRELSEFKKHFDDFYRSLQRSSQSRGA